MSKVSYIVCRGVRAKVKVVKLNLGGVWGACLQKIFETAHSEMLSEGSFGLEYCMKGAS